MPGVTHLDVAPFTFRELVFDCPVQYVLLDHSLRHSLHHSHWRRRQVAIGPIKVKRVDSMPPSALGAKASENLLPQQVCVNPQGYEVQRSDWV